MPLFYSKPIQLSIYACRAAVYAQNNVAKEIIVTVNQRFYNKINKEKGKITLLTFL